MDQHPTMFVRAHYGCGLAWKHHDHVDWVVAGFCASFGAKTDEVVLGDISPVQHLQTILILDDP